MPSVTSKRNAWAACPQCGHKVAKVRTCDMEVKCKHCGNLYEVVIASSLVKEEAKPYPAEAEEGIRI